jgi:NAD(P)H-hydrate repair Nnr-like enzyme with NAD(P)H-hydrate dehydratase domain
MNWRTKMENTKWLKQAPDKPLFPDLVWSRPENRRHAGKLLIAGGNKHLVAAPGIAYSAALKAGIGTCRVLLPDSTKRMIGKVFPEAEFAPSTPSGSFSREALDHLRELANWADGVLLAGDFGRNSETAILLESFTEKYSGQLTVAQDGLDYFLHKNSMFFERENTLPVINFGKLQKLAQNNRPQPPIKYEMNMHQLVEALQQWKINLITNHADQFAASADGKTSTTKMPAPTSAKGGDRDSDPTTVSVGKESNWQVELAAFAATWWLQQPQKPFEALTTAVFDFIKN